MNKEQLENQWKHLQLLLWGDEKKNEDSQFTEWRGDLETTISDLVKLERESTLQDCNNAILAHHYVPAHLREQMIQEARDKTYYVCPCDGDENEHPKQNIK